MNNVFTALVLTLGCLLPYQNAWAEAPRYLGQMDGYYRNTAVLDRTLATGGLMWRIPEWMTRTDFPYSKSSFPTEAPFTDAVTTVRLLGGWRDPQQPDDRRTDKNDLVQRGEDGALTYRWDLLKARLDPYVERDYEITLVLDNVPYALAREPKVESFGQVSPPADMLEWYRFIRGLAEQLKILYGEERANGFRFRVGTEMQDQRRFDGTYEEYLQFYDFAAKAVKEVFPQARFGPFNRSIPKGSFDEFDDYVGGNVSILALAEHAATGTNRATGESGSPFDFLARSLYYFSSIDEKGTFLNFHPDERLEEFQKLWERVEAIDPKYTDLSREVHELGPHLNTEGGIYGLDTGARGAAQTLDTLVGLREIGTDRIWHWAVFEKVDERHTLLMSQGWLYSILDHMRGGAEYSVPVRGAPDEDEDRRLRGYMSVSENEAILLVGNWNVDRVVTQETELSVYLPQEVLPSGFELAGAVTFDEANSVYDVIRADLAEAGLLADDHQQHRGRPATTVFAPGYTSMASDPKPVREFLRENWDRYSGLMMRSLHLGEFQGSQTVDENGRTLSWTAATPSVQVLVFRDSQSVQSESRATDESNAGVTPLGTITPFWRYSAALGPYHEVGQALIEIPDYVTEGDFPYRKRPYPKEVPFADHLSLVRILGGFVDRRALKGDETDPSVRARDLAYRDESGVLQTRLDLLEPRLRPYLDNGYHEFTIVLDNVPWDMPQVPASHKLGQNMPPRDMEEWRQFIIAFCRELRSILPAEAIEPLRFRVGTEMNGTERFGGDQEEFHRFYAASVAAVREVFPEAEIGFFNIAGAGVFGIENRHNVNAFEVVRNNLREINSFTGQVTPAINYVSFSRYFSMGMDLREHVTGAVAVWEEFEERFPELEGISREIHEFGIAPFGEQQGADNLVSQESGALGAASTAIMIFRLRRAGMDRLWHWAQGEVVNRVRSGSNQLQHLFTGVGWLYQVLEYTSGGKGYALEPLDPLDEGTEALALASEQGDRDLLIFASYRQDLNDHTPVTVRFPLPEGFATDLADYQFTWLNRQNATHRKIRDDLDGANLLRETFARRPDRLGTIRQMVIGREGEAFVGERLNQYQQHYIDSLTLRDENAHDVDIDISADGGATIQVTLAVPEVLVLRRAPSVPEAPASSQ